MEKMIVLLHGFGEDHHIFDHQIAALHPAYTIFAPDLPGSGTRTDHQWTAGSETIEWMAEWVKKQLDHQGIERCVMLGHSMGGYITLAFAEKYPEVLQAFGLIHSSAFADSDAKKETRAKAIDFIHANGAYSFLKTAIPGLFGKAYHEAHPNAIQTLIEAGKSFENGSPIAYYRAMIARPDRTPILKNAKVPVLMVAGEEDIAAPLNDLLQQASIAEVTHFHILKNVGHMGMWEDTDNLNQILLNFLSSV